MTYSSQFLIEVLLKLSCIASRRNPLCNEFRVSIYFLEHCVLRLGLSLPDNIGEPVCQSFTSVDPNVHVLPQSIPRTLGPDLFENGLAYFDRIMLPKKQFEKEHNPTENEIR